MSRVLVAAHAQAPELLAAIYQGNRTALYSKYVRSACGEEECCFNADTCPLVQADIYSLACVMYEVFVGRDLLPEKQTFDVRRIIDGQRPYIPPEFALAVRCVCGAARVTSHATHLPAGLASQHPEVTTLIRDSWAPEAHARPAATELRRSLCECRHKYAELEYVVVDSEPGAEGARALANVVAGGGPEALASPPSPTSSAEAAGSESGSDGAGGGGARSVGVSSGESEGWVDCEVARSRSSEGEDAAASEGGEADAHASRQPGAPAASITE